MSDKTPIPLPQTIIIAESINFTFSINTKTNEVKLDISKTDLNRATDELVKLVCLMSSFNFITKDVVLLSNKTIKLPNDYSRLKFLEPVQKALGIIVNEEAGRLFWENRYILEKYAGPATPELEESKFPSGAKPHLEIVKKDGE